MGKKIFGPLLLVLLLIGVGAGIFYSASDKQATVSQNQKLSSVIEVVGLSGSEKMAFLQNDQVIAQLAKNNVQLQVRAAGSRQIAFHPDLKTQDFAFPAGAPGAGKVKETIKSKHEFTPFYTVMAIASWKPIAELLEKNGIAKKTDGIWYVVDMVKLMDWMAEGKRWKDIPNNSAYSVNKSILVSTTDVRKSNSAAMYLALVSYLANGGEVVSSPSAADLVLPKVTPLFLKQGYQENSSTGPFDDYVSMGMGKAPLVMIYEAQFIEYLANTPPKDRNPDMVLMYPSPTVFTKHTLVPLTENGVRFGKILAEDPLLQKLAAEHGLRINDSATFKKIQQSRGIKVPDTILDVVDPPTYEQLEHLITRIETSMQ